MISLLAWFVYRKSFLKKQQKVFLHRAVNKEEGKPLNKSFIFIYKTIFKHLKLEKPVDSSLFEARNKKNQRKTTWRVQCSISFRLRGQFWLDSFHRYTCSFVNFSQLFLFYRSERIQIQRPLVLLQCPSKRLQSN